MTSGASRLGHPPVWAQAFYDCDMKFDVTKEQWIDLFATHLAKLEAGVDSEQLIGLGHELWPALGHLDPETAAEQQHVRGLSQGG